MTKVEAIAKVMRNNGGIATLAIIYKEIEEYYPAVKNSKSWTAGVRGVLYREVYKNKNFKKVGDGLFSLINYDESSLILDEDKDTEMPLLTKIRIGQNRFRNSLLQAIKKDWTSIMALYFHRYLIPYLIAV